jgi:hypothetical protein
VRFKKTADVDLDAIRELVGQAAETGPPAAA